MKRSSLAIVLAAAALGLSACGAPAVNSTANSNANSNANTSKPAAAAPTTEALLALDKQLGDAWAKGDTKFFEENLSDRFVDYSNGHRSNKAEALKMLGQMKCDVKSMASADAKLSRIDDNTYVLIYKST
ncbi:MAG: nuclear transport factor 2 family protein, partial [Acidobacteria bacterium ACB1]|nr:nuclear transport factor 2 family protein [Acidobacteria bacterium ACB1]